jgi:acyl dehydratase
MAPNLEVVGKESGSSERSWDSKDALLYAVGVGAGSIDPGAANELAYTTENSIGVEQRVLPTYAVMLGGAPVDYSSIGDINFANLVHGEQSIKLHAPIPVSGSVRNSGKVTGIFDKGSGMVIAAEATAVSVETGQPLITTTSSVFIRGSGGWGGDRGPSGPRNAPPDRQPDHTVTYQTRPDQALTYRLSGDRNPLHSDPEFAKLAGFPRPILHGLCTFGFTGRALLHTLAGGDDRRFTGMEARFARPVFPGQALTVKVWKTGPGEALYTTENDDGEVVISEGRATFAE